MGSVWEKIPQLAFTIYICRFELHVGGSRQLPALSKTQILMSHYNHPPSVKMLQSWNLINFLIIGEHVMVVLSFL